jgi:hypothetical protein
MIIIIASIIEGFRFMQYIFIIAFVAITTLIFMDVYSIIALIIFSLFLVTFIIFTMIYGASKMEFLYLSGIRWINLNINLLLIFLIKIICGADTDINQE